MICALIFSSGCSKRFKELNGPSFKNNWKVSQLQSAIVWKYLGEKNDFYYFVKDSSGFQINYYKVNKKYIEVVLDKPKEFTLDESQWIYLEDTQIKFKD